MRRCRPLEPMTPLAWCKLLCCIECRHTGGEWSLVQHQQRIESTSAGCIGVTHDLAIAYQGEQGSAPASIRRTRNLFANSSVFAIICASGTDTPPMRVMCGWKMGASGARTSAQCEISFSRRALMDDEASGISQIEKLSPEAMLQVACTLRQGQEALLRPCHRPETVPNDRTLAAPGRINGRRIVAAECSGVACGHPFVVARYAQQNDFRCLVVLRSASVGARPHATRPARDQRWAANKRRQYQHLPAPLVALHRSV